MTSTNSASDLLKFFASLVFRCLWLVLSSDTVGDMIVDLLCASASIEHVRRDLGLMNVLQHCRNLVCSSLRQADFALLVSFTSVRSPSCLRRSASAYISIDCLIEAGEITSRISCR